MALVRTLGVQPMVVHGGGPQIDRMMKAEQIVTDALFVGMTVGFFVLTWALIRLCERL